MDDNTRSVDELIQDFSTSNDFETIETLADILGDLGDKEAIESLVARLCDRFTEINGDIEDAICSALVKLGVMKKTGTNLMYEFLGPESIEFTTKHIIMKYVERIPEKYGVQWIVKAKESFRLN